MHIHIVYCILSLLSLAQTFISPEVGKIALCCVIALQMRAANVAKHLISMSNLCANAANKLVNFLAFGIKHHFKNAVQKKAKNPRFLNHQEAKWYCMVKRVGMKFPVVSCEIHGWRNVTRWKVTWQKVLFSHYSTVLPRDHFKFLYGYQLKKKNIIGGHKEIVWIKQLFPN